MRETAIVLHKPVGNEISRERQVFYFFSAQVTRKNNKAAARKGIINTLGGMWGVSIQYVSVTGPFGPDQGGGNVEGGRQPYRGGMGMQKRFRLSTAILSTGLLFGAAAVPSQAATQPKKTKTASKSTSRSRGRRRGTAARRIGTGAAGGAAIGAIAGGGRGAAIGSIAGAGAGSVHNSRQRSRSRRK
jgi:hypothetical protein